MRKSSLVECHRAETPHAASPWRRADPNRASHHQRPAIGADFARQYPVAGQVCAENRADDEVSNDAIARYLRRGVAALPGKYGALAPTVTTSIRVACHALSGNTAKLLTPTMTAGNKTVQTKIKSLRVGCLTLLRQALRAGLLSDKCMA